MSSMRGPPAQKLLGLAIVVIVSFGGFDGASPIDLGSVASASPCLDRGPSGVASSTPIRGPGERASPVPALIASFQRPRTPRDVVTVEVRQRIRQLASDGGFRVSFNVSRRVLVFDCPAPLFRVDR